MMCGTVGLSPTDQINRAHILHLTTNNDIATLDQICYYMATRAVLMTQGGGVVRGGQEERAL